jgi:hypothetical protein
MGEGRAERYHELATADLDEAGEVLDFVGGGQLAACCYAESHEALVHNGCVLSEMFRACASVCDSRFRSARAA